MSKEYNRGFMVGHQDGHNVGYSRGYETGWDDGYERGYTEGRIKGLTSKGHAEGYNEGYQQGYTDGSIDEYNRKYTKTQNDTQVSDNSFPKHLKTDKEFLEKLQKGKQDCLEHVNFQKIHSVMQHLDWKWFVGDGVAVPSMSKLVLFAQKQLDNAIDGFLENDCDDYLCYSGGFKASVQGFADGFCRVTLEFVVSDWDSEIQGNTEEE